MNAQQTAQIRAALTTANGKRRERAALTTANGKRRERTADFQDVQALVLVASKLAPGTGRRRTCGTVANAYSYRAAATVITVARVGDVVRVRITEGNAAKVAGGGMGWTESVKNQDVTALLAETAPEGTIALPIASARRAALTPAKAVETA